MPDRLPHRTQAFDEATVIRALRAKLTSATPEARLRLFALLAHGYCLMCGRLETGHDGHCPGR